jgi:hypothetical protein
MERVGEEAGGASLRLDWDWLPPAASVAQQARGVFT